MKRMIALLSILAAGLFGVGCDTEPDSPGEAIEEAGDELGDALDEIGDEVEDATDE